MGIFSALLSTANTMRTFERSLVTVQNNVANASTPGYAKQRQDLEALRFEPDLGITGGVRAGQTVSYRSEYAERTVREANQEFAKYQQLASDLAQVEPLFPVTEGAGLPGAINRFFQAASQATVSPNDPASREVVLDRAREIAVNFNQLSAGLGDARTNLNGQIRENLSQVNEIAAQLAHLNAARGDSGSVEPGLDAKVNQLLEELSGLVSYQSVQQVDGSLALYAGGSLLLIGDRSYPLEFDSVAGQTIIRDGLGTDITARISGGRLSGLLESHNQRIPQLQAGLDNLARDFADQVNAVLDGGVDQTGVSPTTQLFRYEDAGPAFSLSVNPLTPQQLALASPGDPGGNGNALVLAGLATLKNPAGKTFTQS
jgi:flagellar hook-associated protein 1 FlgK